MQPASPTCAQPQVAMCEALLAAGFRPTVYPDVGFEARAPDDGEFIDRSALTRFLLLCASTLKPSRR